jgi:hypothetical protein
MDSSISENISGCEQFFDIKTSEDLLKFADEYSIKASEGFASSLKLYFIARYFVAIVECRFYQVPIQVWNEYRNALDHFFRDMTDPSHNHKRKMESHLLRASLDVIKLFCHYSIDRLTALKKESEHHVFVLV